MCGFAGIINFSGQPVDPQRVQKMTRALLHRGPDDEGFYFSEKGAGLGFRRLSIIDLSTGHQPMQWGALTLVFNGEIYNYKELRGSLESLGEKFSTQSDSEVLLRLYAREGEKALAKLNGMYAFAIWDDSNRELFLARDRMGIKPLYYFYDGKHCAFASEIRALYQSQLFSLDLDPIAIQDLLNWRFVQSPHTVLASVKKLAPAEWVRIQAETFTKKNYWRPQVAPSQTEENEETVIDTLLNRLKTAVERQMVGDVPLGCFLSGGVDSSLVAVLLSQLSPTPIQTFSIGFESDSGVDESRYAEQVAKLCGAKHHSYRVIAQDLNRLDLSFANMVEPVADPTILPTIILSQMARKEVKVALSGEGADELFAGYGRYKIFAHLEFFKQLPEFLKNFHRPFIQKLKKQPAFKNFPNISEVNWWELHRDFPPEEINRVMQTRGGTYNTSVVPPFPAELNRVLALECASTLPERLLMKVDMATMSASLEARPPYLDHEFVEWALNLSPHFKIRKFKGKYILRKAAERYLPKEIVWRRKHGFILPMDSLWRNLPRKQKEALLDFSALEDAPFLKKNELAHYRHALLNNSETSVVFLWPWIVLSTWLKRLKEPVV